MKKIIILTGSELRHIFFRKFISSYEDIDVVNTYCEGREKNLRSIVYKDKTANTLRLRHLATRERSEKDFFSLFTRGILDNSNPIFLPQGEINTPKYTQAIIDSNPDLIVAYGCSLIREPLLSAFGGRFLNVHLGLSPYYRGSGTNYWPLVNEEPEYVGATFMYIDAGVDTGEIIHQIRAEYSWGDTPSQIGNRLICKMSYIYQKIITNFEVLEKMPPLPRPPREKIYKKKDFSEESVAVLYDNFKNGLIERYLSTKKDGYEKSPIIVNPAIGR